MQVRRRFCGEEPSEQEVRASAEPLRALQLWRRELGAPTDLPDDFKPAVTMERDAICSVGRWERSTELILKVWIKKCIYQPAREDGRLVDGRLAGKSTLPACRKTGKRRESRSPPVSEFRQWLNRLEQTSTIEPSAEPRPPRPTSGGFVNITACSCSACDRTKMCKSSLTCTCKYYSDSELCNADFMSPPIMLYCTALSNNIEREACMSVIKSSFMDSRSTV